MAGQQTLVAFQLDRQGYAVAAEQVERITPMARLERPAAAPNVLLGFLNLAGTPVPVIALHRLFKLMESAPGLWTPLVVLRVESRRLAFVADCVLGVFSVDNADIAPLPRGHIFNECASGIVRFQGESLLLLAPERLLLEEERARVAELQEIATSRIRELEEARRDCG